jgi:hypothetical protein
LEILNVYLVERGYGEDGTLEEVFLVHKDEQKDFMDHASEAKAKLKAEGKYTWAENVAEILVKEKGYQLLSDFVKARASVN